VTVSALPSLDARINLTPTAEVKVAHAEVCSMSHFENSAKSWKQLGVDIVEYSGHQLALESSGVYPNRRTL